MSRSKRTNFAFALGVAVVLAAPASAFAQACAGTAPAAVSVVEGDSTTLALSDVTAGATVTWDLDNNGSYETSGPTASFSGVGRDGPSAVTVGYQIVGAGCADATGTMSLAVTNVAPTVTSRGPSSGFASIPVTYEATATDPAGAADPLTWRLVSGPAGASITPGGAFTWTPGPGDTRTHLVFIEVSDGDGGTTNHGFRIFVRCQMDSQCDDANACTTDFCFRDSCGRTSVEAGSPGMCAAGTVCSGAPTNLCVQCMTNAQCGGSTPLCNTLTTRCVACLAASDCNDGNGCTVDMCSAENACTTTPAAAGTMCTGGVCDGSAMALCIACVDDAMDTATDTGCSAMSPLCLGTGASASCQACQDTTMGATDLGCGAMAPACVSTGGRNSCVACEDSAAGIGVDNGCGAGMPICNLTATGGPTCVACLTADDCVDSNACTTGACVANTCEFTGVPAGMTGACSDMLVCSGPMGTTPNSCVQCTSNEQCSNPTAFCDLTMNTCGRCTRDFGSVGVDGAACPEENPLCALTGPMMGVCGRCATNADCDGNPAGPLCDTLSGACGTACTVDSACAGTEWCPDSRVCAPKVPNGMSVPAQGPASGICSPTIGTRTCLSGVCFEDDDLCGLPNGEPCMGAGACRSAICSPSGECGECDSNDDCMGGRQCDIPTGMCVTTDAGMADAGSGGPDAGADGRPTEGGVAGGACGCTVNTTKSTSGILVMLGMLALVLARKRRK